jgi:hypothetical protein
VSGVAVRATGVVTGWGRGVAALPGDARAAAAGRRVIAWEPAPRASDRLRRATRECLLAVEAVDALLEDGRLGRDAIAGAHTALVYVTAAAYAAANRAFVEGGGALHFPYTAPSAVPAEVAIEFGLHGPCVVLIGGAATTIDAIHHAAGLLARARCDRALVLAVETFAAWPELPARAGMAGEGPMVEAAAAALLVAEELGESAGVPARSGIEAVAGETLACAPLIALAMARAHGGQRIVLHGRWRGREAAATVAAADEGPAPPARREG